jgi:hypothetical protein
MVRFRKGNSERKNEKATPPELESGAAFSLLPGPPFPVPGVAATLKAAGLLPDRGQ